MSTIDWKAIYGTPGHLKVKDSKGFACFGVLSLFDSQILLCRKSDLNITGWVC